MKHRLKAALIHLTISALLCGLASLLILLVWYPWPFSELAGGLFLLGMICSVDLIIGPLLTFIVFNLAKPRAEIIRDLSVIAVLQIIGLSYGVYTAYLARPVAVVFESNLFKVVTYVNVLQSELPKALPEFQRLPVTGQWLLGTRRAAENEKFTAVMMAMAGTDLSARPSFWLPYEQVQKQVIQKAAPIAALQKTHPKEIAELLSEHHLAADKLKVLPLVSKSEIWSVVVNGDNGKVLGYLPFSN